MGIGQKSRAPLGAEGIWIMSCRNGTLLIVPWQNDYCTRRYQLLKMFEDVWNTEKKIRFWRPWHNKPKLIEWLEDKICLGLGDASYNVCHHDVVPALHVRSGYNRGYGGCIQTYPASLSMIVHFLEPQLHIAKRKSSFRRNHDPTISVRRPRFYNTTTD